MIESKIRIIHSAIELVHEQGMAHAATAKIASHAGVATGTLFHHFPNKQNLFEAVHQYILDDYVFHLMGFFDYPDDKVGRQLKKSIKASLDYWVRNPKYFAFMDQIVHSGFFTLEMARHGDEYLEKQLGPAFKVAIRQKVVANYDYKILLQILLKSIFEIAAMIFREKDEEYKRKFRRQGIAFIWAALKG